MRKLRLGLLLVAVVFLAACGANWSTTLRLIVAGSAPIITVFEQQGVLSHEIASGMIGDVTAEAGEVATMTNCFDAIPQNDPQSKPKHLECIRTLERSPVTQKLLADFSKSPAVQKIANDIDAIIQGAEIFYGGTPSIKAKRGAKPLPTSEKALKKAVKQLQRDLGQ